MDNKVLDEAVDVANRVLCGYYDANTDDTKASPNDAMRSALLAGMKVLLGEPVAWALDGSLTWAPESRFHSETLVKLTKYKQEGYGFTKPLYAPSLGEGDGR